MDQLMYGQSYALRGHAPSKLSQGDMRASTLKPGGSVEKQQSDPGSTVALEPPPQLAGMGLQPLQPGAPGQRPCSAGHPTRSARPHSLNIMRKLRARSSKYSSEMYAAEGPVLPPVGAPLDMLLARRISR